MRFAATLNGPSMTLRNGGPLTIPLRHRRTISPPGQLPQCLVGGADNTFNERILLLCGFLHLPMQPSRNAKRESPAHERHECAIATTMTV